MTRKTNITAGTEKGMPSPSVSVYRKTNLSFRIAAPCGNNYNNSNQNGDNQEDDDEPQPEWYIRYLWFWLRLCLWFSLGNHCKAKYRAGLTDEGLSRLHLPVIRGSPIELNIKVNHCLGGYVVDDCLL
jgi:hypothetical protein